MRFITRILSGYATVARSLARYAGTVAVILLTTLLAVVPLWLLAQYYPTLYSIFALCACALLAVVWIGSKLHSSVRREGAGKTISKGIRRISLLVLITVEIAGVVTGGSSGQWWIRGLSVLLLLVTVGLTFHWRHGGTR